MQKKLFAIIVAISSAMLSDFIAAADVYPAKPVRFVTGGAGSNSDFIARVLGQGLSGSWGQQVIVDNRPSGVILGEIVARSAPDGYTLLVSGSSFWLAPFLQDKLTWHPTRDFAPVVLASSAPNLVVVNPNFAAKSIRELIAMAKARPGEINYASGSPGSTPHLSAELFKAMAGVNIMRINYKGSGTAINDVISGQVPVMFPAAASVIPHVKSGRMRALAVTSAQPSDLVPGLPTVAATGLPGYEFVSLTGVFAPVATPPALIARMNQEMVKVLARSDVKERYFNTGVEAMGGTPEQFGATVKSEMTRLGKVIKDAGIREE